MNVTVRSEDLGSTRPVKLHITTTYRRRIERDYYACEACETEVQQPDLFCRHCGGEFLEGERGVEIDLAKAKG